LSLLVNYAVNYEVETPDWSAPILPDFAGERSLLAAQSVLDAAQLIGLGSTTESTKCRYSSLPVPAIRQLYSNCKIIEIVCARSDYLQMAWNHVVEDSFKGMGQLFIDDYFTNFVAQVHNQSNLDILELLRDPQSYSDPRLLLLLNMMSRGHKRYPYEISMIEYDHTEANSASLLKLNFADICQPEHGDTSQSIAAITNFLAQDTIQGTEVLQHSWNQLMQRLSLMEKSN
jgi:hypothetical protein